MTGTVYRCVCPTCTAYIRSAPLETEEHYEEWQRECDEWLAGHICGRADYDGVENWRVFCRVTGEDALYDAIDEFARQLAGHP